jgi:hypothetical protein
MKLLMKFCVALLFAALFHQPGYCLDERLGQKKGVYQDQLDKQIKFGAFKEIEFDFSKVPLKKVIRIDLFDNKLFILERERNEIYVIDKNGKYLYTVGRPGQGPGDLEYARDFFIAPDNKIYVTNLLPKRIEIFDIKGTPLGRIKVETPTEYDYPEVILKDRKHIFTGSNLNHLVFANDIEGNYLTTILKRKKPLKVPGTNFSFEPQIHFLEQNNYILHFDCFEGIFTKLDKTGDVKVLFSAFSEQQAMTVGKMKTAFSKKKRTSGNHTMSFRYWSNFCVDHNGNIYVISFPDYQPFFKLFVFSSDGTFLYWKHLDRTERKLFTHISCDNESFIFLTRDLNIFKSNWR